MKNIWQEINKPIIALAPMAGYTDSAFRVLCLENGADVVYTEMISTEALSRNNQKTLRMLEFLPEEKNVVVHLFGMKTESFKQSLKIINKLSKLKGQISGVDINLGCPARKVYKTGAGAALMNNKKLARSIIKTVLENTKLPVSIKIRSQVKEVGAVEFIEFIKDLPLSAVMVHGRSLNQGFSGEINVEVIKKIKELLPKRIVLANGGVNTPQDARELLEKTRADGLGIARGALGKPWIFNEYNLKKFSHHKWSVIKKIISRHTELFLKQSDNLIPLRKHLAHYVKGQKNASSLRQKIIKIKTLKDLEKL